MILAAITTCKRKPEMVERAVKSVIAQTYRDWNLVVVDDSPSDYEFRDDVRKMIEGYAAQDSRIRYVPHDQNYGAQRARNTALKIANNTDGLGGHYEFIAYLDDDDTWKPEKLEKQLAKFNEHDEDFGVVYCWTCWVYDETGIRYFKKHPVREGRVFDDLIVRDFVGGMFPLVRTKYLKQIGGFDEELQARQDTDIWLRLAECCSFACVPEHLAELHRYRGEHIWSNVAKPISGTKRLIDKNIAYLKEHKIAYWVNLYDLAILYGNNREYKNFLKTWLKVVSLRPFAVFINLWTIFEAFLPFRAFKEKVHELSVTHPKLFAFMMKFRSIMEGVKSE